MFKLLNILLTLPVGTATVERSFSQMKLVKTRLRNRVSDINLARLMRIAIEGPDLTAMKYSMFSKRKFVEYCCSVIWFIFIFNISYGGSACIWFDLHNSVCNPAKYMHGDSMHG